MRVLLMGIGLWHQTVPSDKQFYHHLISALPEEVTVAAWSLSDTPPGTRPFQKRPEALLVTENRLWHPVPPADAGHQPHPRHGRLRDQLEFASSFAAALGGGLGRLVTEFAPDLIHLCDNFGPVVQRLTDGFPHIPWTMTKATAALPHGWQTLPYTAFIRSSLMGCHHTITHTVEARNRLIALGIPGPQISVIPWGVLPARPLSSTEHGAIRARYHAEQTCLVVCTPRGDFQDIASFIVALGERIARLPMTAVVAIRPGHFRPIHDALSRMGYRHGKAPNLHLESGPKDFSALLQAADLLIAQEEPGPNSSLLPLTWLEALMAGTPAIARGQPGAETCVVDGITGRLARDNTELLSMLEHTVCTRDFVPWVARAQSHAHRYFRIDAVAEAYLEVWRRIIASSRK